MAEAEDIVPTEIPAPKSGNKILPIILVVNTLLMVGVLMFVMKKPSAPSAAGGEAKEHAAAAKGHEAPAAKGEGGEHAGEHAGEAEGEGPGPTLRFDAFIVQIRAVEGDRYAHLTLEVEVAAETDKKFFESRMPRIRDGVIGYLADRTEDEMRGSEGLTQIKEALTKKLDELVPGHRVRGLYITEFIIQ